MDERYAEAAQNPQAMYGLPTEIKFCKTCVISNQRPSSAVEYDHTKETRKQTIHFDQQGVCDACRAAEQKKKIDWAQREKELWELCDKYRGKGGAYDCLVPGSGGKDSFFAAHILKYKFKMNPLTMTWAPHIYTDWGWRNFNRWIHGGFDNYLCTPNGRAHRLLTRLSVEKLFHPFQPFIIGQKACAPKLASLLNIPLVFYGENEAEYGNPIHDLKGPMRDWNYFMKEDKSKIYIGGTSFLELKEEYGLSTNELDIYMPADPQTIEDKKIKVHYLGYYLNWHPQSCYYYSVENGDFEASPERIPGTYSKYNSIDDKMDDYHYYTTYIKFGIGRATYDASQEVRSGDITREEGVALVKKFDGEYPARFEKELFQYLSIGAKEFPEASARFETPLINADYFHHLSDQFRSPHLWKQVNGKWSLRHNLWDSGESVLSMKSNRPGVENQPSL